MNYNFTLKHTNKRHRTGAATIELAIILPLLVVLCLTSVDFGRYVNATITLDNAVRISAEYGATRQFTDRTYADWHSDVIDRAYEESNHISSSDISNLQLNVSATETGNDLYRVNVSADCEFKTVVDWPMLPSPIMLHRELSIRQYR